MQLTIVLYLRKLIRIVNTIAKQYIRWREQQQQIFIRL